MTIKVFVYGTLKPGEVNYWLCADQVIESQPAIAIGQLYHLPFGYPAMTLDGTQTIHGFVLSFANLTILPVLDEFEQHDPQEFIQYIPDQPIELNQYRRVEIEVFNPNGRSMGQVWSYIMNPEQVCRLQGALLPQGHWNSQKKNDS